MNLKNVFKVSALRLIIFVIIYIVLWLFHVFCSPFTRVGGAIMPNGEVGGRLVSRCGFFSDWIWNNSSVYNIYTNINGWYLLLITLVVFLIGSFVVEAVKSKKSKKEI